MKQEENPGWALQDFLNKHTRFYNNTKYSKYKYSTYKYSKSDSKYKQNHINLLNVVTSNFQVWSMMKEQGCVSDEIWKPEMKQEVKSTQKMINSF